MLMNAIIIDNDQQSGESLAKLLAAYCPNTQLMGIAFHAERGLELVREKKPQLVFLDVEMPDMDGIDLASRFDKAECAVIFFSSHHRHAAKAFEINAIDYLLKPVSAGRLVQAVHKAEVFQQQKNQRRQYELLLELIHQQNNPVSADGRVAFSMLNEIVFSWIRNVVWIEANISMCFVSLSDHQKELYIAKNIGEYVKIFSEYKDLKLVHRSHMANRNHIKRYLREENTLEMSDGKRIPVSSERRSEVMEWLGLH